jgi:HEAT repeat protein
MRLNFDRWHDGEGYDLEALSELSPAEVTHVARLLIRRLATSEADWRDIEALAAIGSPAAETALSKLLTHPCAELRLRAARYFAGQGQPAAMEKEIVELLRDPNAEVSASLLMREAEEFPSDAVKQALLDCSVDGRSDLRVHAAALALYLYGGAAEPFDWAHRPLFLRFGEDDREERLQALGELRSRMAPR